VVFIWDCHSVINNLIQLYSWQCVSRDCAHANHCQTVSVLVSLSFSDTIYLLLFGRQLVWCPNPYLTWKRWSLGTSFQTTMKQLMTGIVINKRLKLWTLKFACRSSKPYMNLKCDPAFALASLHTYPYPMPKANMMPMSSHQISDS